MPEKISFDAAMNAVTKIVRDAGGKVVGRTRLQKIACLLELAELGSGFSFSYKHYGPFSEELASAARFASAFGDLKEEEKPASWGGRYSIYSVDGKTGLDENSIRRRLAEIGAEADPIEFELAVTAAFLASQGEQAPWEQTELLKPEKAKDGRLARAKALYAEFLKIDAANRLPAIR